MLFKHYRFICLGGQIEIVQVIIFVFFLVGTGVVG